MQPKSKLVECEKPIGAREWGFGQLPTWAAKAVPDLRNPSSSLLSLLPNENSQTNIKNVPAYSKHHDSRVRRWQTKKPPDAEGTFANTNMRYSKTLRDAPDQTIINYHRDLRIAALVRQSVKHKKNHAIGEQAQGADAEAAELRAMSIRQRFAKRNFHQWGSAVLKAVLEGDKVALETALSAEGVDVDEVVVDAVFEDDEEESAQSLKEDSVKMDSLDDSDSDEESEATAQKGKQGKFGNFVLDRMGVDAAVAAGHVRKMQLGLHCPNPNSRQFKEVTTKVRQQAQHRNRKLAAQAQAALLAAQAASVDGAGGSMSLPSSPVRFQNQGNKTESQSAFQEANNEKNDNIGAIDPLSSPVPPNGLQTSQSFNEETSATMLLPSPRTQAAAIRVLEDKARWKLFVPHLSECDYYIPPITEKVNVFDADYNNNKRNKTKMNKAQIGRGDSLTFGSLTLGFEDNSQEEEQEEEDNEFEMYQNRKIGLFICRGDTLLHIIFRNVHVGYGRSGGIQALAEIALRRGCSWAVRNDKGERPSDIAAQPAGDRNWGAGYKNSVNSVSTALGSVSKGPNMSTVSRSMARRRIIDYGKKESGVLVRHRPNGKLKWYQPSG